MPSTYSALLRTEMQATGENSGTWGLINNTNIGTLLEASIAGLATVVIADADYTLTALNGTVDQARSMGLNLTGTLTLARNVICPSTTKMYVVKNATVGGFAVTVKTAAGTGIAVANGAWIILFCDGTNVNQVTISPGGALGTPSSGTLTNCTGLPIATGVSGLGTGVATALAVNVGSAGAPVLFNGALGTPSSGTVTNLTGTASININGTVGATTPAAGAFTTLSASGTTQVAALTASGLATLNGGFATYHTNGVSVLESPGVSSVGLQFKTNGTDRFKIETPSGLGDLVFYRAGTIETIRLSSTGLAVTGAVSATQSGFAGKFTNAGASPLACNIYTGSGLSGIADDLAFTAEAFYFTPGHARIQAGNVAVADVTSTGLAVTGITTSTSGFKAPSGEGITLSDDGAGGFLAYGYSGARTNAAEHRWYNGRTTLLATLGATGLTVTGGATVGASGNYSLTANGTALRYVGLLSETGAYAGALAMQAGGGSGAYGGSIIAYGHSHATKPGWIVAGISLGSGGKFSVQNAGIGLGADVFTVDASGNVVATGATLSDDLTLSKNGAVIKLGTTAGVGYVGNSDNTAFSAYYGATHATLSKAVKHYATSHEILSAAGINYATFSSTGLTVTGSVGINGTASSARALEITGTGSNQVFAFNNASAAATMCYSGAANLTMATGENAANAVLFFRKDSTTNRSINAAGTVNASGADYAEYEQNNGLTFSKGDVVGFKADGTLTDVFSDAVRFGIKSTNPSYVGGDTWGTEVEVGARPIEPQRVADKTEQRELTPSIPATDTEPAQEATYETVILEAGDTDAEWDTKQADYAAAKAAFEVRLETARQLVDRIAYSGKVPVNVTGASPGEYLIAVATSDGGITAMPVADPTFAQYRLAIGRVNRILPDCRAEVAVMVH